MSSLLRQAPSIDHVGTAALGCPAERSSACFSGNRIQTTAGHRIQRRRGQSAYRNQTSAKTQDANTREFSGSTTGRNSEASARVQFWLLATQYRYSRQPERRRFSDGAKVACSALERESRVCCHWGGILEDFLRVPSYPSWLNPDATRGLLTITFRRIGVVLMSAESACFPNLPASPISDCCCFA